MKFYFESVPQHCLDNLNKHHQYNYLELELAVYKHHRLGQCMKNLVALSKEIKMGCFHRMPAPLQGWLLAG